MRTICNGHNIDVIGIRNLMNIYGPTPSDIKWHYFKYLNVLLQPKRESGMGSKI